jgi:chromate reductase, NAD(P)H dehydrogenase (quinone)
MPRHVLVVSGSTRAGSTNSAFCATAAAAPPVGVTVRAYDGLTRLPHFNPDDEGRHDAVAELRAAIAAADAVVFCTPEYAGTIPGALKNLLEWTVGATVFDGKRVAWVRVAPDARRGDGAAATLATVLGYVQARVIDAACGHVPIGRQLVGPDGQVSDPATRAAVTAAVAAVLG